MKIVSLHIENFGKLHDTDLSFTPGLNQRIEQNGWGKTTLAHFIKVMLYGLQGDGKRSETESDRKRFAPWQGGAFGGSLVIGVKEKEYKITRIFGNKLAEDSFELKDTSTNLVSTDYSEKIGEELLNINADSFLKTVFINQSDVASWEATDDVNAKISGISDGIDLNKFSFADDKLAAKINQLHPTRKTGEIYKLKTDISEVNGKIRDGAGVEDAIKNIDSRIKALKKEEEQLKIEQEELNETKKKRDALAGVFETKKAYEGLLQACNDKKARLDAHKEFFTKAFPDDNLISEISEERNKMSGYKGTMENTALNMAEEDVYRDLTSLFFGKDISDAEFDAMEEVATSFDRMQREINKKTLSIEESEKLESLNAIFGEDSYPAELARERLDEFEERNNCNSELNAIRKEIAYKEEIINSAKKKPNIVLLSVGTVMAFIGIILVVVSVFTPVTALLMAGIFIMAGGVLQIALGLVLRKDSVRDDVYEALDDLRESEAIKKRESEAYDVELKDYLATHGNLHGDVYDKNGFYELYQKATEFAGLKNRGDAFSESINRGEFKALTEKMSEFLKKLGINSHPEEYFTDFSNIKGKYVQYRNFADRLKKYESARNQYAESEAKLKEVYSRLGTPVYLDVLEECGNIIERYGLYKTAKSLYEDDHNKLKDFEEEHDIAALQEENLEAPMDLDEITGLQDDLDARKDMNRENLQQERGSLQRFEEKAEELDSVKLELNDLEEELKEKTVLYERVLKTRELLTKAKENLTKLYMKPLLDGFSECFSVITEEDPGDYHIDANIEITKDEQGK
ncbi:MAG: AAA family ATPase, partial [Lachnospiraceae bacterium]|nr:AAA family ATPase [Lachnospiraceae bacterium]